MNHSTNWNCLSKAKRDLLWPFHQILIRTLIQQICNVKKLKEEKESYTNNWVYLHVFSKKLIQVNNTKEFINTLMNALSNLYHTIEAKPKTAFGITFLFLIAYQLISAFIGFELCDSGFYMVFYDNISVSYTHLTLPTKLEV